MVKGKAKSARQARWLWAVHPSAARKWAHGLKTTKADWAGGSGRARRRKR